MEKKKGRQRRTTRMPVPLANSKLQATKGCCNREAVRALSGTTTDAAKSANTSQAVADSVSPEYNASHMRYI